MTLLGTLIILIGITLIVLSASTGRSQAEFSRRLGERAPWLHKIPMFNLNTNQKFARVWMVVVGLMAVLVGSLWLAGIGVK